MRAPADGERAIAAQRERRQRQRDDDADAARARVSSGIVPRADARLAR